MSLRVMTFSHFIEDLRYLILFIAILALVNDVHIVFKEFKHKCLCRF